MYEPLVNGITRLLRDTGLIHFAYTCDRESSRLALLEAAIVTSNRKGVPVKTGDVAKPSEPPSLDIEDDEPDAPAAVPASSSQGPLVAVPELTHPGESQSNGLSERAVQAIEDHSRTISVALGARINMPVPSDHAVAAGGG